MAEHTLVPRPGDPRPGPEGRPETAGQVYPSRILIVEDEAELVRALRINLRARQYEVLTAGTGREALALAANHPPDAIILDLGLPDIDGTEVIVELPGGSRRRSSCCPAGPAPATRSAPWTAAPTTT